MNQHEERGPLFSELQNSSPKSLTPWKRTCWTCIHYISSQILNCQRFLAQKCKKSNTYQCVNSFNLLLPSFLSASVHYTWAFNAAENMSQHLRTTFSSLSQGQDQPPYIGTQGNGFSGYWSAVVTGGILVLLRHEEFHCIIYQFWRDSPVGHSGFCNAQALPLFYQVLLTGIFPVCSSFFLLYVQIFIYSFCSY